MRATGSLRRADGPLCAATILVSACLLFLVQPLISKLILPWFGGSAAVWTTCLLFYQIVLLGGYLYAHALTKLSPGWQAGVHGLLLLVSVFTLPVLPGQRWMPTGTADPALLVLGSLAASVGLPYFLLSATSPLVQSWFARAYGLLPYRYFALSNAGSLLALVSYPVLIEPSIALHRQAWMWSGCYVLFVLLGFATAWRIGLATPRASANQAEDRADIAEPSTVRAAGNGWLWLTLAAAASALLLAVSNQLIQNLAPIPLLWVLPLSIYLATFILCFEGRRWYRRGVFLPLLPPALGGLAISLSGPLQTGHLAVAIPVLAASLFICCMLCHGELAALKPAAALLTRFYLTLAAGGALGGLFVAGVAPRVFNTTYEFPIAVLAVGALMIAVVARRSGVRPGWRGMLFALLLAAGCSTSFVVMDDRFETWKLLLPVLGLAGLLSLPVRRNRLARNSTAAVLLLAASLGCLGGFMGHAMWDTSHQALVLERNFYGALAVNDYRNEDPPYRGLVNGVISHGSQFLDFGKRLEPTTYYTRTSGVGLAIAELQAHAAQLRIGVIGLGAGTLAAYGRPGDEIEFYDINPAVARIARSEFTFLAGCQAKTSVITGDARISLTRQASQGFDLLVVDAFTGDAIPVHLLTREAFALYWRHLRPDGVLAVHISNRYLNLAPVVARGAADFRKEAIRVDDNADENTNASATAYALLSSRPGFFEAEVFRRNPQSISPLRPEASVPAWTDDYSNLFRILKYW